MMQRKNDTLRRSFAAILTVLALGGCGFFGQDNLPVPTEEEARGYYEEHRDIDRVEVRGNVVEVHVNQPPRQLRRGGSLWARVGPYITLFSPSTRDLFEAYPGLAAVRVVTHAPGGEEVARAMVLRDDMNELLWKRALNLLGHALQEGTERPTRLEDLVHWGEEHAEFTYNPDYVPAYN